MPILQVIIVLAAIGFIAWAITTFIPMEPNIRKIIIAVAVIAIVFWLVSIFVPGLTNIRVG